MPEAAPAIAALLARSIASAALVHAVAAAWPTSRIARKPPVIAVTEVCVDFAMRSIISNAVAISLSAAGAEELRTSDIPTL